MPMFTQGVGGIGQAAIGLVTAVIPGLLGSATQGIVAGSTQTAAAASLGASGGLLDAAAATLLAAADALMIAAAVDSIPFLHGGGLIGSAGRSGKVGMGTFAGAPKYHTGGIIGLKPREVPMIGKRGEEVLTENDPRHISNYYKNKGPDRADSSGNIYSNSVNQDINIDIKIEGGGGTPAQNDDLAKKTAKELSRVLEAHGRNTYDKKSRKPGMKVD